MTKDLGRPRNFDEDDVLDRALNVFWRHGFQGASLAELTAAMGLNKPSLYAAFGDKEGLYLRALERYMQEQLSRHAAILVVETDARRAIERFLRSMAKMVTDPALPGGCFLVNGTADCGGQSLPRPVELALREALQGSEAMLLARLKRAKRDGQLGPNESTHGLTAFYMSLFAGLCVLAKGGADRSKLDSAITAAMRVWPRSSASIRNRGA